MTVAYLDELYERIARQKRIIRALASALIREPSDIPDRLLDSIHEMAGRDPDDLTVEEVEALSEQQREVMLLRLAGKTFASVAAEMRVSKQRAVELHRAAVSSVKRSRRRTNREVGQGGE